MKNRKPVSRVDSNNTHGWFARVYRAEWVGPRSFTDRQYGGRKKAEIAANQWVEIAEERLPVIRPMPILKKASVHVREDKKSGRSYFDVYIPSVVDKTWTTKKYYFETPDDERKQRVIANNIVANQNILLVEAYNKALAKWTRDYDRIMREILSMWNEIKAMPI